MLKGVNNLKIVTISALKRVSTLARRFFWAGLYLLGLAILLGYALRWWPGDRFRPVLVFNALMPWLLSGLLFGNAAAAMARRRWLVTFLAIPTLLIGMNFVSLFFPSFTFAEANSTTSLKVMSYNVWWKSRDVQAVAEVIRQEQPDIILLQELNSALAQKLKQELVDLYPDDKLYFAYEWVIDQAIISRYPISEIGYRHDLGRVQMVIIDTPSGPFTVWNVHPVQPRPWRKHYRQMAALAAAIAEVEGALIIGGDFNTTDQSDSYKLIERYLPAAHREAGWGFGFSFPAPSSRFQGLANLGFTKRGVKQLLWLAANTSPTMRIDHIFYSDHFLAQQAYTLENSGGSDHLPVVAELSFR